MNHRRQLLALTVAGAGVGLLAGTYLLQPLLGLIFPVYVKKLDSFASGDIALAARDFSLALALMAAALPLSALITEAFARRARYSTALAKSVLVGLLALVLAAYYQAHHLASLDRLAAQMPGLFGPGGLPMASWTHNPITKIAW